MKNSSTIYEKLCEKIPGGVNSPVRACLAVQHPPLVASSALGAKMTDVDERTFIDYCMSWGALIHGHAHQEVIEAIQEQLWKGTTYGVTTELEEKLAGQVIKLMPSIEMIRFVSSGTEATMSAIRLARGFTGRDLIIKFEGNYHGHADFLLVKAGSGVLNLNESSTSQGIPKSFIQHTLCLPFNDCNALEAIFNHSDFKDRIACVILEPIAGNMGVIPATHHFIKTLQALTQREGALLIFDEVMTGFRVAKGGAQFLYDIKPDLTCLGKIVGGGLPAAAFGGRREIMQYLAPLGPVYQAGTLSGNPLAMVAGLKTLNLLDAPGFYENLQTKTDRLLNPLKKEIKDRQLNMCIQSSGSMFTPFFGQKEVLIMDHVKACDLKTFSQFFAFLFKKGIYIPPLQQEAWFLSTAHSDEELDYTKETILEFLQGDCIIKQDDGVL